MHNDVYQQMKAMDQKYGDMSHKKHTAKDHAKMTKNRQNFKNMQIEDFFEDEYEDAMTMTFDEHENEV